MLKLKVFCCLLFYSISFHCFSQDFTRVEIPVKGNNTQIKTIPVGDLGILLVSKPNKTSFSIERYDINLEVVWSIEGPVDSNYELLANTYYGNSAFLLFGKSKNSTFRILKVNIGAGFIESFQIKPIAKFEITEFKTLGYSIFMSGMVKNESVLIYSELNSGQSKLLPSTFQGNSVIQSIELDTLHQLMNVSIAVKKGEQTKIIGRSYRSDGTLFSEIASYPDDELSLLSGRIQVLNDSTHLLVGTYSYSNLQSSAGAPTQGLYISKFVNEREVFTKYHSFTNFDNFFRFMSVEGQEKIKKKIQKKKKGSNDLKLNYTLLVHDLVPYLGNYLLIAEIFYPEFKNQMLGVGGGDNGPILLPYRLGLYNPYFYNPRYVGREYNRQVFDGYVYTHAIVAGISKNGNLLWDNSVNFDDIKSSVLGQKIKIHNDAMGISKLFYSKDGKILSNVLKENTVIDANIEVKSVSLNKSDKIKKTTDNEVEYWFGNHFISWGFQKIIHHKNSTSGKNKRNVFFLSKITF